MKKIISLMLVLILTLALVSCGETPGETGGNDGGGTEGGTAEPLKMRVAVMPYAISMPVFYAIESGLAAEHNMELEMVMFTNGATMNEAMASDQFDVALIGGAGIYGIATYDGVYISDQVYYPTVDDGELTAGDGIYCVATDPAAQVKGYNKEFPNVYGDPETVRGKTILYTSGTTAHQLVIMWLNDLGVAMEEVEMLNMDFAQSYQALKAGQADFVCLTSPYTSEAQQAGYTMVADGKSLHKSSVESMMAPRSYYEANKESLAHFINLIYDANSRLEAGGAELKAEWMEKWYDYNGSTYTHEDVLAEFATGYYATWDNHGEVEYGKYAKDLADFYLLNELLTEEAVENVSKNIVTDVMDLAKTLK